MSEKLVTPALRILVVEDHFPARFMLSSLLGANGHVVTEAENGEQALRQLEQSSVDLLITDVHMPVMDGITLTMEVRRRFPHIFIMVISSDDVQGVAALEAGAHLFLLKPFAYHSLMEAIDSARGRSIT